MLQQTNNAVRFFAFYAYNKQGVTGLTVNLDIYGPNGTITTGVTGSEVGSGLYAYTLSQTAITTTGEYAAVFKTTSASVDMQHIPSLWVVGRAGVDNLDATVSSRSTATTAGIADAVWDEALNDHATNGTFGARVVRSLNSNNTLQLTGSHHAAADVHEFQDAVITAGAFAPSAITLFSDAMRTELTPELDEISEVHLIHGLQSGSALTVTPSSRTAGAISQTITGDGTTSTTVTRD